MDTREKILKIMQAEELNALQFASEIGIQSSTLSHILNGRNKPSLDVVKKILNRFRTVNADWLILDSGTIYRQEKHSQAPSLFPPDDDNASLSDVYPQKKVQNIRKESFQEKTEIAYNTPIAFEKETKTQDSTVVEKISEKKVNKIIVYYTDNTYQEFSS